MISAQVSIGINAPATAAIQIVPLDEALLFKPRTMVHLFFLDMRSRIDEGKIAGVIGDYKLLFSGELIGVAVQQTSMSRGLILQCVDFSSYWDSAQATFLEYGLGGNAFTDTSATVASNTGIGDDIVSHQAEMLVSWLKQQPHTPGLKSVSGLAGGIIRMLEAVGGVPNEHRGVNDFFTVAELRCRVLSQITAEENDNTARNLLDVTVFDEWVRNGLQNAGQQVSFRDMMKILFQYIYYEVVPNPAAKFEPATKDTTQRLRSQIIRPDCWFSPPPTCNVIFPEQYTQFAFDRNFIQEVTRSLVMLFESLVGPDALLATRILAPNLAMKAKGLSGVRKLGEREDSYRILMPHELHTGIIARSEWLPNTAASVNAGVDAIKGARLSWGQRVALFHFFKYRFAPRTLNLAGRFLPNVVCGFPAAIIRAPYQPLELGTMGKTQAETDLMQEALDQARELGAPSHFIGMVSSVTHGIDQNGGNTAVAMHHVRQHMGTDDEFLRMTQDQVSPAVDKTVRILLDSDELQGNARLLKLMEDVTPQGDVSSSTASTTKTSTSATTVRSTVSVVDPTTGTVTQQSQQDTHVVMKEEQAVPPNTTPPFTERVNVQDVGDGILVPKGSGVRVKAGDKGFFPTGKIVTVEVLSDGVYATGPSGRRMFKKVQLYEKLSVSVTEKIPVEEIIRPRSWFSPKYANTTIGEKIYQPFFGCSSVIDNLVTSAGDAKLSAQATPSPTAVSASSDPAASLQLLSAEESKRIQYTIERALNAVAYLYGRIKAAGLDVDEFISQYTDRPIATMRQMFGDLDKITFDIAANGKVTAKPSDAFIGFHTMAIHPQLVQKSGLAGLVDDPSLQLRRINNIGTPSSIPTAYDVRNEKYAQVMAYYQAIVNDRAFRG